MAALCELTHGGAACWRTATHRYRLGTNGPETLLCALCANRLALAAQRYIRSLPTPDMPLGPPVRASAIPVVHAQVQAPRRGRGEWQRARREQVPTRTETEVVHPAACPSLVVMRERYETDNCRWPAERLPYQLAHLRGEVGSGPWMQGYPVWPGAWEDQQPDDRWHRAVALHGAWVLSGCHRWIAVARSATEPTGAPCQECVSESLMCERAEA